MAPCRSHRALSHWRWCSWPATIVLACGCGEPAAPTPLGGVRVARVEAPLSDAPDRPPAPAPAALLQRLPDPEVREVPTARASLAATQTMAPPAENPWSGPRLLGPQQLVDSPALTDQNPRLALLPDPDDAAPHDDRPARSKRAAATEQDALIEALLAEAAPPVTGAPTDAMVGQRAQQQIRRGYELAQRGAYFAARAEFMDVLRSIADAKDQKAGGPRHSAMLAQGFAALDEAADFHRPGVAKTEVDVAVILSSHLTEVGHAAEAARLMPQQLVDLYLRYAQRQLGAAVAGDPAGSMALHALGKVYTTLGKLEPENQAMADRRAFALQQSALAARTDNYLAAHELGVLLAESGHYGDAANLLAQVAIHQSHPVAYRNLARVERKLGRAASAAASEARAVALASRMPDAAAPVAWMAPQAFTQAPDGMPPERRVAVGPGPAGPPQPQPFLR